VTTLSPAPPVEDRWANLPWSTDPIGSGTEPSPPRRSRFHRLVRGRPEDPAWARPALLGLLALTAVLYLWDLGASGWANSFYSAAVQAGTQSWKAFLFGSSDASNFITVDKPPAFLWVMEISARIFGLNAWSVLVPQALEGVATVALVYASVRRWFGAGAGLIAAAVAALTPAGVLMFRFNNPDALLALLLTLGVYCITRALEAGSRRWLLGALVAVGFGFITKEMQAFLVVPAFGLVYLWAAPVRLGRRIADLGLGAVALIVSSGWWVAVVELWPASDRPYIGGSQDNSLLNVIFGYNGLGRITGNETGSVGGGGPGRLAGPAAALPGATTAGGGGGGFHWGATGLTRLFQSDMGSQVSWLLPAVLLLLVGGLVLTARSARTDRARAGIVLWGLVLLVTGLIFSMSEGIIHPYYTVALAPGIGALVGIGSSLFWARRGRWWARSVLASVLAVTVVWSVVVLGRSPTWHPGLRPAVMAVGALAVVALLVGAPRAGGWMRRLVSGAAIGAGLLGALGAPAAYSLETAGTAHAGSLPTAGPTQTGASPFGAIRGGRGGPGGFHFGGGGGRPFFGGGGLAGGGFGGGFRGGAPGTNDGVPGANPGFGAGGAPGFGPGGGFAPFGGTGRGGFGGAGGLLNGSRPSAAITKALQAGASRYRWVAAAVGSNTASGYQLSSGDPVMAIGGFNGTDPAPALGQFQQYVAAGEIHYFIAGGGFGAGQNQGASLSAQIASWVESNFTAESISGTTVYNLVEHR
jgi:4-amino-4-deoxy-L-arabinose transferase-like glycosyltransferase